MPDLLCGTPRKSARKTLPCDAYPGLEGKRRRRHGRNEIRAFVSPFESSAIAGDFSADRIAQQLAQD
jgi:hypothetical protein